MCILVSRKVSSIHLEIIQFINISGVNEVDPKLKAILETIMAKPVDVTTLEELITFFKHLAFVACAAKAPIREKMLDESLARIAKAGEAANIERWCWWTPTQLSLLELAARLSRVILIGGNGTGKTVMLDAFAAKTAKENPEENVLFAINYTLSTARSLLQLELEVKYEKLKLKNINVKSFRNLSELRDVNLTNQTVCIDEIHMKYVNPKDLHAIKAKSLWIVIRDTDQERENPEEYLKKHFPDWVVVNLRYPLRTSKNLSDEVKNGQVYQDLHSNNFNLSLEMAQNMPMGPKPLTLQNSKGSYQARIQQAFCVVGNAKVALIILDYYEIKPEPEETKAAKKISSHPELAKKTDKASENLLVGLEAVKACQRPHGPPLLWFQSKYAFISDDKKSVKEWMKGKNRNISGRDLITDSHCVAGYEADFIIYIGDRDNLSAYMSRCRGQFIHIV